jgi:hypothetical protein
MISCKHGTVGYCEDCALDDPGEEPRKFFCAAGDCEKQCDLCRQEEGNP